MKLQWFESRFGSLDDMFAYKVPVQAVVKDARLGLLQLGLWAGIFVYVAIFNVWGKCKFLAKPDIEMALRATVREPKTLRPLSQLDYCCDFDDHHCPDGRAVCQYFTGDSVFHSEVNSIEVVTRRCWYESEVDDNGVASRKTTSDTYVADIENFTLMIEPNIFSGDIVKSGTLLQGRLYVGPDSTWEEPSPSQHELCAETRRDPRTKSIYGAPTSRAPCYVQADFQVVGNDVFKISTILRAANVSLDATAKHGSTPRKAGLVIGVNMEMVSWLPYKGLVEEHYIVKLLPIEDSVYSKYKSVGERDKKEISHHDVGLQLLFHVQGTLARWSLTTLMVEVTTYVALLAVAGAVVKFLAINAFHFGRYYYHAMTLESPDFDDIENLDGKDISTLEEEHRQVYGWSAESKEKIVINLIEAKKPKSQRTSSRFSLLGASQSDAS